MTVLALHADFETRSACELKVAGLDNYSKHPTTSPWCLGFAFGKEPIGLLTASQIAAVDLRLAQHVADGGIFVAHNAAFEIAIWNEVLVPRWDWPVLRPEQCRCTMATGYAMALPGALDAMAPALGIRQRKDMSGHRLMMMMAKPREIKPDGTIIWWDEPEKLLNLYSYCKNDVEVERAMDDRLMQLSDSEQAVWALDQRINGRGVYIDQTAVRAAIAVANAEQDRLNVAIRETTDNFVGFTTETARLKKWCKLSGVDMEGVAKADIIDALEDPTLPLNVRSALLIRKEAGKTSTAKLRPMLDAVSDDGRLHGMLQYHGAGTGRWAGRRVQLHNFPRPQIKQPAIEDILKTLTTMSPVEAAAYITVFHAAPLDAISWSLRGLITAAPGNVLYAADFKNIEGRGLAWLAGEEWKLDAFRAYDAGTGPDLYKVAYSRSFGVPVDDIADSSNERQVGKVQELAFGYAGGVGAGRTMCKIYNVKLTDEEIDRAKHAWRDAHPKVTSYWYDLERAFKDALTSGGSITSAGPRGREVKFRKAGSFMWCLLPSGRPLCYPYPWIDDKHSVQKKDGDIYYMSGKRLTADGIKEDERIIESSPDTIWYMHVDGLSNKWTETSTYSGKIAENVTQAICRDLLVAAMWAAENNRYPVVLTVHDEVVSEVPKGTGDLKEFEQLCSASPAWARGLPVVAAGWTGHRYRKG